MGFPDGSEGKESACSVGDLGSIPGLGRTPVGGNDNPLQYSGLENSYGQRSLVGYSPWGGKESDTTERLSTQQQSYFAYLLIPIKVDPEEVNRFFSKVLILEKVVYMCVCIYIYIYLYICMYVCQYACVLYKWLFDAMLAALCKYGYFLVLISWCYVTANPLE